MRLQVALDCNSIETALRTLDNIYPYVDIAELGTGLMISEGAEALRKVRREYPDLTLLSDIKLMDGGAPLANIVLEAGADIVTVLGAAANETISGVISETKKFGKETFADLICVADVQKRAAELDGLGVSYVGVHTSYDLREKAESPLEQLKQIKKAVKMARTSISGGIKLEKIPNIIEIGPEIIITGSYIMNAADQRMAAKKVYDLIHQKK